MKQKLALLFCCLSLIDLIAVKKVDIQRTNVNRFRNDGGRTFFRRISTQNVNFLSPNFWQASLTMVNLKRKNNPMESHSTSS